MKKLLIQLTIFMAVSAILVVPTYVFASNDLLCMATNIWHESRGEPEAGMFMVGFVTLNRVNDPRWPGTVCKVVYQPGQFLWTSRKQKPAKGKLYNKIIEIASIVMQAQETKHYGVYFDEAERKPSRNKMVVGFHEFYE